MYIIYMGLYRIEEESDVSSHAGDSSLPKMYTHTLNATVRNAYRLCFCETVGRTSDEVLSLILKSFNSLFFFFCLIIGIKIVKNLTLLKENSIIYFEFICPYIILSLILL